MFSRFSRRGLCFLLALVTLCMCLSPALTQPAEAVAAGVVAGTVAIGATAVVAAMLSGLGVKPGSNSSAWDNLVSQVENHLTGLGYIVDGAIKVASFKPTDDPEKLKAAIAQDIVGLTAQWLSDEDIVQRNPSIAVVENSFTYGGITFNIISSAPVSAFPFQALAKSSRPYWLHIAFYSTDEIKVDRSTVSLRGIRNGFYIYVCGATLGTSETSYGLPILNQGNDYYATSIAAFLGSAGGVVTKSDLDVSSVPANFTDIPAAYPSWVSSGVADAGITYLPIGIYIPGTEATPLPTEVPDPTDATDPSEDPDKNPDDPSEGAWLWPGLQTMFTELKENADKIGSAVQEKIDSGLERLGDRVQQLQDGILPKIEAFQNAVTQGFIDCQNWLQGLGETISSALDALGTKLSTGIQSCFDTLREFATQTFPAKMAEVGQWIQSLPEKMAEAFKKILPQQEDLGSAHPADWKTLFPFCVPFDLIEFLGVLNAEPEVPVIRWRFYVPWVVDYEIEIDLSVFDGVAQIMRTMELLAFCISLILLTRNIIRG